MTTISQITPQNAPRDAEGLKKTGIFQLRILTEGLGGLQTEEQKQAYSRMTIDEKVNLAMQLLQMFDRANPGMAPQQSTPPHVNGQMNGVGAMPAPNGAPPMAAVSMPFAGTTVAAIPGAPGQQTVGPQPPSMQPGAPAFGGFPPPQQGFQPPPQGVPQFQPQPGQFQPPQGAPAYPPFQPPAGGQVPPMQQQPLPGMPGAPQVAQVDPSALAAAQAAAGAAQPATGGGRKPRNSAAKEEAAANNDLAEKLLNAVTGLAQVIQAQGEAMQREFQSLRAEIEEVKKNSGGEQLKNVATQYEAIYNVLTQWNGRLPISGTQLQNSQSLTIGLLLFVAEQVLQAPRGQVLQAAAGEIGNVSGYIQQLSTPQQPGKA